jgi:short-subunit dehydrogenase
MIQLNGKVIWITGASSGIGEALAYELSKLNNKLILSSRNREVLEKVKENCADSTRVAVLPLDLAEIDLAHEQVHHALSFFGPIDVLVNNGGISQRSLLLETDISVDRKLMEVDYLGPVALTKALLPHFIHQKSGVFVTVSSLMGKFGSPYRSGYCGAKHALHGFFDVLRMEHEKDNIQVTLICPGFVQTNVAKNALTADGSLQHTDDEATQNGLSLEVFIPKMIAAVERQKFEAYIGKKEVLGIWVKRFFPRLLHKLVLKSQVR